MLYKQVTNGVETQDFRIALSTEILQANRSFSRLRDQRRQENMLEEGFRTELRYLVTHFMKTQLKILNSKVSTLLMQTTFSMFHMLLQAQ